MVDITVRGAGIFGLSIAWACVQRGARVRIIDPNGPAAGSSGGIVGALAPHVPEKWSAKKAFQLDSLLMAESFWTAIAKAGGGESGYTRSGRLQPIADAHALDLARARARNARDLWQGHARWQVRPVPKSRFAPNSPSGWVIHDTLSALIHPRQACLALVDALAANGTRVIREGEDRGRTVWATGAKGLDEMTANHHRLIGTGAKGQAALLAYAAPGAPQLFVDGLHIVPHLDGTTAVGSTTERTFDDPTSTDGQLENIISRARAAVPALHDAVVIQRWAGLRPRSRSRAPMLGAWPEHSGHFIANGGFKIGFGMAPKVAEVMADLMLEDSDVIPDGFRVEDNL